MKKKFLIILDILVYLEYTVIAVLIALTIIPRLFDIEPRVVLSQSMVPDYNVNDVVYIDHKYDFDDMKQSDVVATVDTKVSNQMIIHRVVDIDKENSTYITKGDANKTNDAPSLNENLVGEVKWHIPYIGAFINVFKNVGFLIFACGLVIFQNITKILLQEPKKKEEQN